jgi:hypothetical protein
MTSESDLYVGRDCFTSNAPDRSSFGTKRIRHPVVCDRRVQSGRWPRHRDLSNAGSPRSAIDDLAMDLVRIVCAVYWLHPLVWVVNRRISVDVERACDDAVLRDGQAGAMPSIGQIGGAPLGPETAYAG